MSRLDDQAIKTIGVEKEMNSIFALPILLSVLFLSGCASIVSGSTQSLSVDSFNKGSKISQATCTLTNNKGTWFVSTPGTVSVHRSYDPLTVKCEKDGLEPGILTVKSSTKGMAFGNILFGGVIGAGVDMGTGAAYDYPALITVLMGETQTLAPPKQEKPTTNTTSQAEPVATPDKPITTADTLSH